MKTNFLKKATTALVAVMSLASAAMITTNAADYSGNYHDKYNTIHFTGSSKNTHTKTDQKLICTSTYIRSEDYSISNAEKDKYSYAARIYGSKHTVGQGEGDSFWPDPDICYCNYGPEPFITPGSWSYIPNLVGENKYKYAFLVLWQKKESSVYTSGAWSPDSI